MVSNVVCDYLALQGMFYYVLFYIFEEYFSCNTVSPLQYFFRGCRIIVRIEIGSDLLLYAISLSYSYSFARNYFLS
jgi:hypothetical protein